MSAEEPTNGNEPEVHELAKLMPPMTPEEFDALKADVHEHGLQDPITTCQGKVVDGVHRHRACHELGLKPRFVEWDGRGELLDLVISRNLHRRHLTESQRAMVAAKLANLTQGRPAKNARQRAVSQGEAARLVKVGRTSVQQGSKVIKRGVPALAQAVERGEVPVATAARVAELDFAEQVEVVAQGAVAVKKRSERLTRRGRAEAQEDDQAAGGGDDESGVPAKDAPPRLADLPGDQAWLEALPLWGRLGDPTAFRREALAWRYFTPILEQARQDDPAFDESLKFRSLGCYPVRLLGYLATLEPPDRWTLCRNCKGSGKCSTWGRCQACHGDGFAIRCGDVL